MSPLLAKVATIRVFRRSYRQITKDEDEGIEFAWGYFCDQAIQSQVDREDNREP